MSSRHEDDTALDAIAAQVRGFPPLPESEVTELLAKARFDPDPVAGHGAASVSEQAAQERLVEHHLGIALAAALARRGHNLDVPDLYQEGALALHAAVVEYALHDGVAAGLRVFAERFVGLQLDQAIAEEAAIRESERAFAVSAEQLQSAEVDIRGDLARQPTVAELAVALNWTEARVEEVQRAVIAAREMWDDEIVQYLDEGTLADDDDGDATG